MKPSELLEMHREKIRSVIASHRVSNVRVFGSVLYGCDTEDSDLDLLVDPSDQTTLFDICAIRIELRKLLGVKVDVLTPEGLPIRFREEVIAEAVPV